MSYNSNYNNGISSNNNNNSNNSNSNNGSSTNGRITASTTYQNVLHKKQLGTLILTDEVYTFYPHKTNHNNGNGSMSTNANANANANGDGDGDGDGPIKKSWLPVIKHQVSPVTHARNLLKLIVKSEQQQQQQQPSSPSKSGTAKNNKMKAISVMFEFKTREDVENIRKDVSNRLLVTRKIHALNASSATTAAPTTATSATATATATNKKRNHDEMNMNMNTNMNTNNVSGTLTSDANANADANATTVSALALASASSPSSTSNNDHSSYTHLTTSQYKVASSSLLASYPTFRTQYSLLLQPDKKPTSTSTSTSISISSSTDNQNDAPILSNDANFWSTHSIQQSNQLSKIMGITSRGLPSTMKSSLDIQITNNTKDSSKDSKKKDGKSGGGGGGGGSSSNMGGPSSSITLGVEEMKQIFILYPAVHATYEEKVPLELSEELFWRKYLESEYFHRDRGKLGMSAKVNLLGGSMMNTKKKKKYHQGDGGDEDDDENDTNNEKNGDDKKKEDHDMKKKDKKDDQSKVDENVRVAAASSNDIFSRKELELQRLREQNQLLLGEEEIRKQDESRIRSIQKMMTSSSSSNAASYSQKKIAVGQFDLTSTANTERGSKLLLHSNNDAHPSNDCGKKVIEKYNKHWAMVLNPNDAVAGCDLTSLARKSVRVVLDGDDDANVKGGNDAEMKRLVNSASATIDKGTGGAGAGDGGSDTITDNHYYYGDNVLFEDLELKNINAYSGQISQNDTQSTSASIDKQLISNLRFSKYALDEAKSIMKPLLQSSSAPQEQKVDGALPDPRFGQQLLMALTKKLVEDSKSDKDTAKMTNDLPQDFRKKFTKYFRRSSELLRHFFALRRLMEIEQKKKDEMKKLGKEDKGSSNEKSTQSSRKLERIVTGLEDVYREMESMKNTLPSSELGESMRKMFRPVMDQLDWASKLHKDGLMSNNGPKKTGGFGFVDVT